MKKQFKKELSTYYTLHWWNMGKKTLSFKGELKDLLLENKVNYSIKKTDNEYIFEYTFKNPFGITFKSKDTGLNFPHIAKQFLQMELVRMGDKAQLYVQGVWRPTVNINY